jgi:mannosyltransferase
MHLHSGTMDAVSGTGNQLGRAEMDQVNQIELSNRGSVSTLAEGQRNSRRLALAMLLVILLGSILRFYQLGSRSLWFDEAASVNNARSILTLSSEGTIDPFAFTIRERVPPLYFLLLTPFYLLSHSEAILRLLSVISGIISLPLMYLLGAQLFSRKIGLIGAILLAVSPFHIYYSQELRPYSLFLLFSLLALYLSLLAIEKDRNIYYVGWSLAIVLGIYTHLYMLFLLLTIDIYFLLNLKKKSLAFRKWLIAHACIAILCLPEVYLVIFQVLRGNINLVDFPPGLRSIVGTFYIFVMGRVLFPTGANIILVASQCVIWGAGFLIGIWALWRGRATPEGDRPAIFLLAAGIVYSLIWIVSMLFIPLFDEARVNYLIFLLPFFFLLTIKGWDSLPHLNIKIAALGLAVILCFISNYPYFFEWEQVGKGDFRAGAAYIQQNLQANDKIYHTTNTSTLPLGYYLDWQVPQIQLTGADRPDTARNDQFWLVIFKQTGGATFSGNLLKSSADPSTKAERSSIESCQAVISDSNFSIVDSKMFPGKNVLIICRYRKVSFVPS